MNNKNENAATAGRRTSAEFDWTGFLVRLVATLVLVLATYNPSGWSFAHWVQNGFSNSGLGPEHFVVGIIVLIGWVILLTDRVHLGSPDHPLRHACDRPELVARLAQADRSVRSRRRLTGQPRSQFMECCHHRPAQRRVLREPAPER